MKTKLLSLLLVLMLGTVAEAAPIYTNLEDAVVQVYEPGIVVELLSVEPFRFGGFMGTSASPSATLENPFSLGPLTFDGKYFRVTTVLPTVQCGSIQIDADSHDFVGIGRLFVTGQSCAGGGGSMGQQLPPTLTQRDNACPCSPPVTGFPCGSPPVALPRPGLTTCPEVRRKGRKGYGVT